MEPDHEPKLDICHLCGLGATYPRNGFFVDPYVKIIPHRYKICITIKRNISQTSIVIIFSWTRVDGRALVALSLQVAKLPKISQNNGFKICELI